VNHIEIAVDCHYQQLCSQLRDSIANLTELIENQQTNKQANERMNIQQTFPVWLLISYKQIVVKA